MILLFIPLFLFALDLSSILSKPKSYVRDFYLTEYMKETNSTVLAYKAYEALYKKKGFHLKILSKKSPLFNQIYKCIDVDKKDLKKVDIACVLDNGYSLRTLASFNKKELKYLYDKLPDSKVKRAIAILLKDDYKNVFNDRDLGYYFILNYPDKKIDVKIEDFSKFRDRYFYLFIRSALINGLKRIQSSLLKIDYKSLSDKEKWWLFLTAMSNKKYDKAQKILFSIKSKNSKIYFWRWLLGNKSAYNKLLNNPRIDIYTLYVHEEAKKPFEIRSKILYNTVKKPLFDQTNPWEVLKFYDKLKNSDNLFELAHQLDSNKSLALKAIVLDKAFKYKYNIYIAPKIYEDKNKKFKAFVYAIIRQESRFVPASVSRSYALGAMQIMPFLVRELGGDVFKQFNYTQNVKLGVKHLKMLFKLLKDPLMVAYAYNGGAGFVKRKVLPNFKYHGKYEPFLSMEMVPYSQSREYGKKVITNYVVYSHLFGVKKVTLHKILKK